MRRAPKVPGSDDEFGEDDAHASAFTRHTERKPAVRRYDRFIDALAASLWFRPALWMIVFFGLAFGLVAFDIWLDRRVDVQQIPRLLRSNPDDARALLAAIAGAMLTVVSLAFSVVMLAVVQMSNAYSPRLLRLYIGDIYNQHVLGILLGTFVYCLIVLRSIRQAGFAPTIATNFAVVLAIAATIALVAFLNHVPQSIKVNSIIRMILASCEEELEREFPSGIGEPAEHVPELGACAGGPQQIVARRSGYVQIFDLTPLAACERSSPAIIRMHWCMGDFVLAGTPFASVWGRFGAREQDALDDACVIGTERTMRQDPRFGLEQLTDVGLRALSPGINDPTTACAAINALTVLLGRLLTRDGASPWRRDRADMLFIEFRVAAFSELIELTYLRILSHGRGDQQVLRRLIGACEQLCAVAGADQQREALCELLRAIHAEADEQVRIAAHRNSLDVAFERACTRLACPPLPKLGSFTASRGA